MKKNNIKFYLSKWIDLNREFIEQIKRNYHYKKKTKTKFDDGLIKELQSKYSPVFVLSTGRCGTEYLTKIFALNEQIDVFHSPHPELLLVSKFAYENYNSQQEVTKHIFESARIELMLESYLRSKIFVETNNKITFFAYAINELYPKSKFIHLVRHPGDFVRSGIRRKWYNKSTLHDLGRITPSDDKIEFSKFNDIQKISWLWNETNLFIEEFKEKLNDSARCLTIKAEDLFGNISIIDSIFEFVGAEKMAGRKFYSTINEKVNVQENVAFPKYIDWGEEKKGFLKEICTLADKYNYRLLRDEKINNQ